MKASELVQKLQDQIDEHGNFEVIAPAVERDPVVGVRYVEKLESLGLAGPLAEPVFLLELEKTQLGSL